MTAERVQHRVQLLEVNLSAAVHIARDERLQQDVAVRIRVGAARTPRLVAAVAVAAARRGSRGGPVPVPVPVPCVALFFVVVHVVAEQASHAVRHRPGTSLRVGLRAGWTVHAVLQLRSYNPCRSCMSGADRELVQCTKFIPNKESEKLLRIRT